MAVIDYEAVKASVGEVYKAGKEFPQKELFYSVPQDKRAAKAAEIMQDTINAIANHFLPQKISVSLWQKATQIAKVSAEKIITPKLFNDAITEAQKQFVADNVARCQQEKQEERAVIGGYGYGGDEEKIAMTSALLRWTYKQMGRGRMICPYLPTEDQISEFVLKNKIPRDVAQKYRTVIRAYLNDYNFAQSENAGMSCKLFNRGNKLELIVL